MTGPSSARTFSFGVVLLAAGRSGRMGQPKLLLPWGKTSVLGHLIGQWTSLGVRQIAVVCAARDEEIHAELDRIRFAAGNRISNPDPDRGMFSSIQCAAEWKGWEQGLTHWVIALGDQPHLRIKTLLAVLDFAAQHPLHICIPRQGGHRRHPVVLPKAAFERLATSRASDLKEFLDNASSETATCELEDAGLALDIDRPEDYQKALQAFPFNGF